MAGDRLAGKCALITGGSQGIGRAIALAFAAAGASVVIGSLDDQHLRVTEAELLATGRKAAAFPADVGRLEDCRRLVQEAQLFLSRVDILVNNAGGGGFVGPLHELPPEAWDVAAAINLRAPAVLSALVIPGMLERKSGVILSIASTRGLSGRRNYSPYCSTKAALIQLTRCMALDYADQGIRVNCIAPGAITTERGQRIQSALSDPAARERFLASATDRERARLARLLESPEEQSEMLHGRAPMKRRGLPEEIAATALFLCSDEASYTTGQVLAVDGGRTAGV